MATSNADIRAAAAELLPYRDVPFSFAAPITANSGLILNFREINSVADYLAVSYESAAILSVSVHVSVNVAAGGHVAAGFGPAGRSLNNATKVMAQKHSAMSFASTTAVTFDLELPTDHLFGRELLGAVVGNPNPVLSIQSAGFPAGSGVAGFVKVLLWVRGCGYPATPIAITLNN